MSVLVIPVILLQQKRKRKYEVSQTFQKKNTKLSKSMTKFPPSFKRRYKKKSRIGLLHRNQFAEGIQLTWTIISQIYRKKKDLPTSANDTIIYRLSLWYKQWKVEVAYSKMQHDSTLDAPKNFWMTSKTVIQ